MARDEHPNDGIVELIREINEKCIWARSAMKLVLRKSWVLSRCKSNRNREGVEPCNNSARNEFRGAEREG
jgi:hypothetical protein